MKSPRSSVAARGRARALTHARAALTFARRAGSSKNIARPLSCNAIPRASPSSAEREAGSSSPPGKASTDATSRSCAA